MTHNATQAARGSQLAGIGTAGLLACVLAATAGAAAPPDAGSVLRDVQPAPIPTPAPPGDTTDWPSLFGGPCGVPNFSCPLEPAPGGATFTLRAVTLQGNDSVDTAELAPLYAQHIGQTVSFADLHDLAARIARHYHEHGYVLAQVIVPAQEVTGGHVRLTVLEGRIGRVHVSLSSDAPIDEARVAARLRSIEPGQPLTQAALERALLLLSDLPGLRVGSSIEAGSEPGTVDLTVTVEALPRTSVAVELDNHGIRSTGELRASLIGRINSPTRRGDNFDFRLLASERADTLYGSAGYETPVGAQGTRLGIGLARMEYALGREFAPLQADGTATVVNLSLSHPLVRSRARTLLLRAGVERRQLKDSIGVFDSHSKKVLTDLRLDLAYEGRDALLGGGFSSASLGLVRGHLSLRSEAERAFDQSPGGRGTAGGSLRTQFSASRLNALSGRATVFAGVSGQYAWDNLDSAARLALGGPRAVRAYSPAEAVVDTGIVATAELRYALTPELTATVFYDWGTGRYNARRVAGQGENSVTRAGAGLGAYWSGPHDIGLAASVAWRTTSAPRDSTDRKPRLYVQMSKRF